MNKIIKLDFQNSVPTLNVNTIKEKRKLNPNIRFNNTESPIELKQCNEHTCEPIKDVNTLRLISEHLIRNKRYRDNMIFILGINFGLRVSDLHNLRFTHIINPDLTFKDSFPILEQKTENTRKNKRIDILPLIPLLWMP